jgi:hypothetical protein
MARWEIMTTPARPDGPLSGTYADDDLRFRLRVLADQWLRGEAAARTAQAQFEKDVAAARRNGQSAIVDAAIRAGRAARPLRPAMPRAVLRVSLSSRVALELARRAERCGLPASRVAAQLLENVVVDALCRHGEAVPAPEAADAEAPQDD